MRRNIEARQRGLGRVGLPAPKTPLGSKPGEPLRVVKKSESVEFEMAEPQRLSKIRATAKLLTGAHDVKLEAQLGKAREECFVVFD